ncbi:MAG: DUF3566 domain-containing protein [Candidatus Marinimicrobia bacterium]|nr:DUF3566 domain-containing protein [Candidatus Neomarinimicrobiota bacterium]MCH7954709.1 DUF3566 domain-containing protein [Candidatus Neomarinimicrobiota bacterium]
MIYELKSFDVWSVARTVFIISLIIHLLLGLTGSALILLGVNALNSVWDESDVYYEEYSPEDSKMPILVIFIFVISIGLSIGYMILSAVVMIIYNKLSGLFGGIEVEINELSQLKKTKLLPKVSKDADVEENLS